MPYPNPRSALVALATPFALPAFLVLLLTISAAWGEDTNMDTTGYTPRAVILIIGDGMDDQQISIARNYLKGAAGKLLLDTLPVRSAVGVLTVEDTVDGRPIYVADSANTATSIATGAITSRGRIATTAGSDRDLVTIIELASAAGYRTGIVTTASVTDATPAAFASHVNFRLCENPDAMVDIHYKSIYLGGCPDDLKANGGPGSIAEQLASSGIDVILGGGRKHFEPQIEGGSVPVSTLARQRGFQLLTTKQELSRVSPPGRVLGLFSAGSMPVRLQGQNGRQAEEAEPSLLNHLHDYIGDVTLPAPMSCEPNPEANTVPSLREMTDVALDLLAHDNNRGFFLMVESASIDKQAHERKPCGSIGEMEQLDEALASALAYADKHPRTLVIVTADHSQAAQLVPAQSLFAAYPVPIYSPGMIARIQTPEGSLLVVNYATNNFSHEEHTGANVPLFSNGEGQGRVPAYAQQPELFTIMREYLSL
ncbi:MAG: alkaline phosphatase [Halioglobus sp.]|nr:alkaline phosphatase [Halioglobus sp.]